MQGKGQQGFASSQGWGPHQPDFLKHRQLPDPGLRLVTNITDGHMVSLQPETKWNVLNPG